MLTYARLFTASFWRLPAHVKRLWVADFEDVRIILEQQGDLKYFSVSKGVQRVLARSAIVGRTWLKKTTPICRVLSPSGDHKIRIAG
jgi:hypothetical protein